MRLPLESVPDFSEGRLPNALKCDERHLTTPPDRRRKGSLLSGRMWPIAPLEPSPKTGNE
jgi:hypothetical protein